MKKIKHSEKKIAELYFLYGHFVLARFYELIQDNLPKGKIVREVYTEEQLQNLLSQAIEEITGLAPGSHSYDLFEQMLKDAPAV